MSVLRDDPLLLVFVVAAVGYLAGRIRVGGFGFGVAAVLFAGLAFGMADPQLKVPRPLWTLGLVLFVYTVGLAAGPGFVAALRRRGVGANVLVLAADRRRGGHDRRYRGRRRARRRGDHRGVRRRAHEHACARSVARGIARRRARGDVRRRLGSRARRVLARVPDRGDGRAARGVRDPTQAPPRRARDRSQRDRRADGARRETRARHGRAGALGRRGRDHVRPGEARRAAVRRERRRRARAG